MTDFKALPPDILLGLCLWGEARGEPVDGQVGVGWVVRRRVERRRSTYQQQILAPWQFSAFNANDPNRSRLEDLMAMSERGRDNVPGWRQALYVARGVIGNYLADNVKGADHYVTAGLYTSSQAPSWADAEKLTVVLGRHAFFNLEG